VEFIVTFAMAVFVIASSYAALTKYQPDIGRLKEPLKAGTVEDARNDSGWMKTFSDTKNTDKVT
jgi:hypothetical protein